MQANLRMDPIQSELHMGDGYFLRAKQKHKTLEVSNFSSTRISIYHVVLLLAASCDVLSGKSAV